jgi:hypothetical protein
MNRQHKHEDGHEDSRSSVTNVGEVPPVGDPLEVVPPSEDENGFSKEPEKDEDAEAGENGPLVTRCRAHALIMLPHGLRDLFVFLVCNSIQRLRE